MNPRSMHKPNKTGWGMRICARALSWGEPRAREDVLAYVWAYFSDRTAEETLSVVRSDTLEETLSA
jgi:hypothetical protein